MIEAISYVTNANLFWLSMGMTASIGIFVGALIYNGDITMFKKGILTMSFYIFFLLLTTTARITDGRSLTTILNHPNATAGLITIIFITFFYMLGMCIGVIILNSALHKKGK